MYILGLDTSLVEASAVLTDGLTVIGEIRRKRSSTHSRDILRTIDELLLETSVDLQQIDLVAVAVGPGSFTGLRIGLGSALGLADSIGKPVAGVGTLDAIARANVRDEDVRVCPIIKAQRGYVYAALYGRRPEGIAKLTSDMEISPESLAELIDAPVRFIGDGYAPHADLLQDRIGYPIEHTDIPDQSCAQGAALLAWERAIAGDLAESGAPAPKYISRSQAEVNFTKLQSSILFSGDDQHER